MRDDYARLQPIFSLTARLAQGGKGLGAMWGRELACEMLREAGFKEIDVKELPHDPINYYYIIRK